MDWIAVGLCADVPEGTVVPRRINDTELAIWCSRPGVYHAWGDRCPHRGMRLSHGFVRGDKLACIYHGWQYGRDGACSYIPAHPALMPPKTICTTTYDCRMQGEAIWVALRGTNDPLPSPGGRRPIRTLEVSASANAVADKLGHPLQALIVVDEGFDLALALQPGSATTCLVHSFAAPDQDRKAVSRHLEKLRLTWEAAA